MKRINIQFHATNADIFDFVLMMLNKDYKACGIRMFPKFEITLITKELNLQEINTFDMIIISKTNIQTATCYRDFISMQNNNIGITVGKESNGKLFESSLWVFSEKDIDLAWKREINELKKKMIKGAWVNVPNTNKRFFYKNHLYTNNAKLAYESGTIICPMAGWNTYDLVKE